MKKFRKISHKIFLTLPFLLLGKASATSPDVASRVFRNLNFCNLLFKEFNHSNNKYKNISIIVYDADTKKLKEKSEYYIELFKKEFGKDDLSKIYIGATAESAYKFFNDIEKLNQIKIDELASDCRKVIYE